MKAPRWRRRLCTGACIGLASFGLIGFVLVVAPGLTPFSIALRPLATAAPFGFLLDPAYREQVQADVTAASRKIRQAVYHPGAATSAISLTTQWPPFSSG